MDFVNIRLSGADDHAIRRFQAELRAIYPDIQFDRMHLGRDGDWMCYGHYDAGSAVVRMSAPKSDDDALLEWFRMYKRIRQVIARLIGQNHTALQHLDRAMRHAAGWTVGKLNH